MVVNQSVRKCLNGLFLAFVAAWNGGVTAQPQSQASVVIRNATVVSPERGRALRNATIILSGDRILWVGHGKPPTGIASGASVIDARGKYVVPGLIDSHVHVNHPIGLSDEDFETRPDLVAAYFDQLPRSYLYFGFTTLVDLDLSESARKRFQNHPSAPTLRGCGRGIRYFGGYGPSLMPEEVRYKIFPEWVFDDSQVEALPSGIDAARHTPEAAVEAAVKFGAVAVKTYHEPGFGGVFNWPTPSALLLRRITAAAHARKLPVFLHATGLDSYRAGIDAGVDVFAHGLWHWPGSRLDPTPPDTVRRIVSEIARRRIAVQPTVRVILGERDTFTWDLIRHPRMTDVLAPEFVAWLETRDGRRAQRDLAGLIARFNPDPTASPLAYLDAMNDRARRMMRLYRKAGVRLIFGSDTPASEGVGNPPGLNGYLEIQAWAEAGIEPAMILRALTLDNARAVGLETELGTVEAGKRADLLILNLNPLDTPKAYDAIRHVILGGKVLDREGLSARNRQAP